MITPSSAAAANNTLPPRNSLPSENDLAQWAAALFTADYSTSLNPAELSVNGVSVASPAHEIPDISTEELLGKSSADLRSESLAKLSKENLSAADYFSFPNHREKIAEKNLAYSPAVVSTSAAAESFTDNRVADTSVVPVGSYPTSGKIFIGNYSLAKIRSDFPILAERVAGGQPLIWFDNAATTQRPQAVIDRLVYYYQHENSNVHRGAHELAARSTNAYEDARQKVADFIGAPAAKNIVWVRGTTEGINLVAQAFVKPRLRSGDEIVVTELEHHANIVPWQMLCAATGAVLRVAPIDDNGEIILPILEKLFNARTKFLAVAQVSNALGTISPIGEITCLAHRRGVPVLVDAAQSVSHIPVNVAALDVDFFVFSGHKIFGPTGIGVVYGTDAALAEAQPYQGGGNMIADVSFARTVYQDAPMKLEAGTGNIADAVGLGAAIDYVKEIGIANIAAYEHRLLHYCETQLRKINGLRLLGNAKNKTGVLSFVLENHSVPEVGKFLSERGIALRAGHHCAQPAHRRFGVENSVRPSFAFYNTCEEIDALIAALKDLTRQN